MIVDAPPGLTVTTAAQAAKARNSVQASPAPKGSAARRQIAKPAKSDSRNMANA